MSRRIPLLCSLWLLACVPTKSTAEQDTGASESTDELGDAPHDLPDASETTETGDEPECDYPALEECTEPATAAWAQCRASCGGPILSCADELCEVQCDYEYAQDQLPCRELYCSDDEPPRLSCYEQCKLEAIACVEGDCVDQECSWSWYECTSEECHSYVKLILDYVWAGSCEIMLPGPVYIGSFVFGHLEIAGQEYSIGLEGQDTCDQPWIDSLAGPEGVYDRITLCGPTCEAFAAAAEIRVALIPPPTG